jgi:hypothetical protein
MDAASNFFPTKPMRKFNQAPGFDASHQRAMCARWLNGLNHALSPSTALGINSVEGRNERPVETEGRIEKPPGPVSPNRRR